MMDEQGTLPPVTPEALEELRRLLRAHGISLAGVSSTVTERKTEHDLLKLQVEMLERKVDTLTRCMAEHVTDMHKPEHNPTVRLDPNDPDSITATPTMADVDMDRACHITNALEELNNYLCEEAGISMSAEASSRIHAILMDDTKPDPDSITATPTMAFDEGVNEGADEGANYKRRRCRPRVDGDDFVKLNERVQQIESNGMLGRVTELDCVVARETWLLDCLTKQVRINFEHSDERLKAVEKRAEDMYNGEAGQNVTDIDDLCERLTLLEDRTNARWGTDKDAPHGEDKKRSCRRIYGARPNKPMTEKEQRHARAELLYGKLETPETRQRENRDLVDDAIEGLLTSLDRDHGVHIVGRVRASVIAKARNAAKV